MYKSLIVCLLHDRLENHAGNDTSAPECTNFVPLRATWLRVISERRLRVRGASKITLWCIVHSKWRDTEKHNIVNSPTLAEKGPLFLSEYRTRWQWKSYKRMGYAWQGKKHRWSACYENEILPDYIRSSRLLLFTACLRHFCFPILLTNWREPDIKLKT